MIDGVDHVAVAVRDLDAGLPYYVERLGLPLLGREELPEAGVRVVYLRAGTVTLQLVQPLGAGPLADFLAEQGEGLHHVCFAVADIPRALETLATGADVRVVPGGRGRRACCLPPQPTGLRVELTETEPSRSSPSGEAGA